MRSALALPALVVATLLAAVPVLLAPALLAPTSALAGTPPPRAPHCAWGTRSAATPAGIVTAWMHSRPHREVILTGTFRDIGIGVSPAVPSILGHGQRGATYAVEFATRS